MLLRFIYPSGFSPPLRKFRSPSSSFQTPSILHSILLESLLNLPLEGLVWRYRVNHATCAWSLWWLLVTRRVEPCLMSYTGACIAWPPRVPSSLLPAIPHLALRAPVPCTWLRALAGAIHPMAWMPFLLSWFSSFCSISRNSAQKYSPGNCFWTPCFKCLLCAHISWASLSALTTLKFSVPVYMCLSPPLPLPPLTIGSLWAPMMPSLLSGSTFDGMSFEFHWI